MHVVYSLTNRTYSAVRGVVLLLLGLLLLLCPSSMLHIIVKVIAAFLIAMGIVTLIFTINTKKEAKEPNVLSSFAVVNIVVNILFGLLIFIFPDFFVSVLVFLFGAVLLVLGISQIINLFLSSRHASLPAFLYVVPIVVTICGIILFFQPFTVPKVLTMFFGACLAAYGLLEMMSAWMLRKVKFDKTGKYVEVQDIPFEEVKPDKPDNKE